MKKTHEQFLENLWNKNKHYREGKFEVIGEYIRNTAKILVKNKYGVCVITPASLLIGVNPHILSAINKSEYFRNMCIEKFGDDNDDLSCVEYINNHTKVKVIDEFGIYYIVPNSYLNGCRNIIKRGEKLSEKYRSNTDAIIDKLKLLHPDLEILPFNFINQNQKILVKDKYGVCEVSVINLLRMCKPSIASSVNPTEYFINHAREVHGDKYDYSLVEYKNNRTKVKIIGKFGIFEQVPNSHLSGRGCPLEGRKRTTKYNRDNFIGWAHTKWKENGEKSKYFDSFKVYYLECCDEENQERFIKIGKTFLTVQRRYNSKNTLPYKYNILCIKTFDCAIKCSEYEDALKRLNKDYRYLPTKKFGGMHECFSQLIFL